MGKMPMLRRVAMLLCVARACCGTGVPPVNPVEAIKEAHQEHEEEHGQDAHATKAG